MKPMLRTVKHPFRPQVLGIGDKSLLLYGIMKTPIQINQKSKTK